MSNETEFQRLSRVCQTLAELGLSATSDIIMDLYDQVRQSRDDLGMVEAQNKQLREEVCKLEEEIESYQEQLAGEDW